MDQAGPFPDRQVDLLQRRLLWHRLWDAVSVVLPPVAVLSYLAGILFYTGRISGNQLISLSVILFVVILLGTHLFSRIRFPSPHFVAGLVDQKVEGKDRFLTLATIESSYYSSALVNRLRREAAALLHRIDLKRDFPYRWKPYFMVSLICSAVVLALFHLFWFAPHPFTSWGENGGNLRPLAQKLSQTPGMEDFAEKLDALSDQMRDERIPKLEKLASIQEMLGQIKNFLDRKGQSEGEGTEELNQLDQALRGLQKEMEESGEGGGGLKTNLPDQENRGGQKLAKSGGNDKGTNQAKLTEGPDPGGGKAARDQAGGKGQSQGESPKGKGAEEKLGQGEKEMEGRARGGKEGKGKASRGEQFPSGAEPERFLKPGESEEQKIQGARFVIVKLPESESPSLQSGDAKGTGKGASPKIPVSNIPLSPSKVVGAASERQQIPLEYRDLIR